MKNQTLTCLFYFLLFTNLFAQDKVLTIKGDTIQCKVNAIEGNYLKYSTSQESQIKEIEFSQLHKVIWRSGQEYVINKEIDDKLKNKQLNQKTIVKVEQTENSTTNNINSATTNPNELKLSQVKAPELRVKNWVFWKSYLINNQRVKPNKIQKVLFEYDTESYKKFTDGLASYEKNKNMNRIASGIFLGSTLIGIGFPTIGIVGRTVAYVIGIRSNIKQPKAYRQMREAIQQFENRRKNNYLRPILR